MRIRTPLAAGAAALLLSGLSCAIDDNSAEVFVEVTSVAPVVVRGEKVQLVARARRLLSASDTTDIKNIRFVWTTSDPTRATIVGDDFGGAELTGVNAGQVEVSATAVAFEGSSVGYFQMRVANFLEIDSVVPSSVKWGEKVRIHGVGVRNIFVADLGTPLFADTLTFQGDPLGLGAMEFWVPPPARTDSLFVLGPGVFFTVPSITTVDTVDVYEPNDFVPSLINLDAPGPYPIQLPLVRFFNPALAFEEAPRDSTGSVTEFRFEWYRFQRSDTTLPVQIVLKPAGLVDSTGLFIVVSDSIQFGGSFHSPGNPPTWFVTSEGNGVCNSIFSSGPPGVQGNFSFNQSRRDSTVLSFKRLPGYGGSRGLHILAFYTETQRYALSIYQGFQATDSRIGQDRFEENDLCSFADSNWVNPATRIDLNASGLFLPFLDSSVTIDTPHEVDWYRFRLTAAVAESVMFKVRSRPFGGPIGIDRSDVDFEVIRASDFAFMGAVSQIGTRDSTRLLLAPGDYYLVTFDFAGEVTRYSICIRPRFNCVPLVGSAEASVVSYSGRSKPERPRPAPSVIAPGRPLQPFRKP